LLLGETITINRLAVAGVWSLSAANRKLSSTLDRFVAELGTIEDGALYTVPDFESMLGLNEALALANFNAAQSETLTALWMLSGKVGRVRCDDGVGNTVLTYRETLPPDLLPLLVLDASGGVRYTYAEMSEGRGNINHLAKAPKLYSRLTAHVWSVGGGKSSFKHGAAGMQQRAEVIAKLIDTKPDEEWLVVHHKTNPNVADVPKAVRAALTTDAERVKFLEWGSHHGTNDYRDIKNVVLAGVLYYRKSAYEALGRLSRGMPPEAGAYPAESLARVTDGELRHHILQAANRGAMRNADGDECHPCDLYVIAKVDGGTAKLIGEVFPRCEVKRWRVGLDVSLSGKVRDAFEWIKAKIESGAELVKISDVAKALDLSAGNFTNRVRRHPEFVDALAEIGVTEWGRGQRLTHFRAITASDFGFTAHPARGTTGGLVIQKRKEGPLT